MFPKKLISFVCCLLILVACKQKTLVEFKQNHVDVSLASFHVAKAEPVAWQVGIVKQHKISKGFKVEIELPQLDSEQLNRMAQEYGVDAWLIRVMRRTVASRDILQWIHIPLKSSDSKSVTGFKFKQIRTAYVNVYYAAAAISTRLERLSCPALDHNKLIDEVVITDHHKSNKIVLSKLHNQVLANVEPFSYAPIVVNGGSELAGDYYFELAFYDSAHKRSLSEFVEAPQYVKVAKEKQMSLPGCSNFNVPSADQQDSGVKKFKFGQ